MSDITPDSTTPPLGTPPRMKGDLNQTTLLIDVRGLAKSVAQPSDPIPLLDKLLLDIEQNRFAFISSRDPDAAVHELFNRLEELARIVRSSASTIAPVE